MHTITWVVEYSSPPAAVRYCSKCREKSDFISSGLFRVNAQQKLLDIWLVYRCAGCKTTWNMTILSRLRPKSIDATLLRRFMQNDAALARQYAMDAALLRQNGAEAQKAPFTVLGPTPAPGQSTRVIITSAYPLRERLSSILRQKLALSGSAFDAMAAGGTLRLEDGADIRKCRLLHRAVVLIDSRPALP